MRYLLKLNTVSGWYEEADEHTYKNRAFALNKDGTGPRYCDGFISIDGDTVRIELGLPIRDIAILSRYLKSTLPTIGGEGFVQEQPDIVFKRGRSVYKRSPNGEIWRLVEQKQVA